MKPNNTYHVEFRNDYGNNVRHEIIFCWVASLNPTYGIYGIQITTNNVSLLRESFKHVMQKHPFTIDAFVLLPDHLHCLCTLLSVNLFVRWPVWRFNESRLVGA